MYGYYCGYAIGTDPSEAARISTMIDLLGQSIDDAIDASVTHSASTVLAMLQASGTDAVVRIGPALDSLTRGTSKPATQYAWHLNRQLAAIRPDPVLSKPWWTSASANHGVNMLRQIQAIYTQALADATR